MPFWSFLWENRSSHRFDQQRVANGMSRRGFGSCPLALEAHELSKKEVDVRKRLGLWKRNLETPQGKGITWSVRNGRWGIQRLHAQKVEFENKSYRWHEAFSFCSRKRKGSRRWYVVFSCVETTINAKMCPLASDEGTITIQSETGIQPYSRQQFRINSWTKEASCVEQELKWHRRLWACADVEFVSCCCLAACKIKKT